MYAIKPKKPSIEEIQRAKRDYFEASQPLIKILCHLESISLVKMVLMPNGEIVREYTTNYYEAKKQVEKILMALQRQLFSTETITSHLSGCVNHRH